MSNPEVGKSVLAAGIETNYLHEGSGPPVVLLHGSGPGVTGYVNWRFILPKLAPAYACYAPDIVGFGYTARPKGYEYKLDNWVAHVVGFLDALGIPKAHFVGNSFGGALTLALAARHPERVGRFVLMGSGGVEFTMTEGLEVVWGYQPTLEYMTKMMGYFAYNQKLLTPEIAESRYQASIRPGHQESYAALFPAPRERHIKALCTPEEKIRALPHEVLVVHGREDRVVPLEASLKLHQLLQRSQLHVYGQCGHWTQVEKADRFARLVLDFLGEEARATAG